MKPNHTKLFFLNKTLIFFLSKKQNDFKNNFLRNIMQ